MPRKKTKEEFIKDANIIHNGKYEYSKVEYNGNKEKVCIICPKHGEFWMRPNNHLGGQGCPKCKGGIRLTYDEFVRRSNEKHNGKYDYSKVNYINAHTKVCIICPEHGEFWQEPGCHIHEQGCSKCGDISSSIKRRSNKNEFVKKAIKIYGSRYDYSKVVYVDAKTPICIICKKHGEFWQRPNYHLQGCSCLKCGMQSSKGEDEIFDLLSNLKSQKKNKTILNGREIDIYIPCLQLGIDYNGLIWHSEKFNKDKSYHLNKLNDCNKKGIKLIQIFEDEWLNHKEICESKLRQVCGLNHNLPKTFARKCNVNEINNKEAKEAKEFLTNSHIQGFVGATVYLGCFYNKTLVGVMSFKREKDGYWDLNRFATDINYHCVGVGGKLFKYFITHYDFVEIKSFADRRWTVNPIDNLYTKLGFEFVNFTKPDYRYFGDSKCTRYHKFGFRKQILHKKYGLPLTMTEYEMTKTIGFYRIWNCGLIKYVYKKDNFKNNGNK